MNETAGIGAFWAALAGLGIFIALVGIVLWVLKSMGLSKMAQKRGIENEWLAWLPVADLYIMGTIVEEMNLFGMQIKNLGLWFPVISLLGGLLSSIPILGIIIFIGILVFQIAFIYKLFSMYTNQAVLYTVLCVFFGFLWPIFIFSLRNNAVISQEAASSIPESNAPADSNLIEVVDPIVISPELVGEQEEAGAAADDSNQEIADGQDETANIDTKLEDKEL